MRHIDAIKTQANPHNIQNDILKPLFIACLLSAQNYMHSPIKMGIGQRSNFAPTSYRREQDQHT